MVPSPSLSAPRPSRAGTALEVEEYFAPQRTPSQALPDPEPLLANLTIGLLEVLAGVREADQLARWLGEDAFRALVTRSNLSARARSACSMRAETSTGVISPRTVRSLAGPSPPANS